MGNAIPSNLTFGIFDHLDDNGCDIAQQYSDRLRLAEACDGLGFYAYHLAEHHCTPHGRGPSPNLFLSSVAQRTRWIRIGPLVMLLPLYHPLRAFEEICMLDQLSGGRVEVGIGRGSLPIELSYFGMCADAAPGCYAEASEILLNAMRGGTLSHKGQHFELSNIPLTLKPHQSPHPPMWIATGRPESARWAAANGANIACLGPSSSVRKITDAFRAHRKENTGEDDQSSFRGLLRMIVIGRSDREAWVLAAPAYEHWLASFEFLYELNDLQTPPNLPLTFDEAVENELCIAGSAASVRQTLLSQVEEAGANYLLCQLAFGTLPLDASLYTAATIQSEFMARLN
ncbi:MULTISPECIES: LLM class flavin-dependent oxidoreductase [Rhizobium]|uniref:Alkanesulfonate monooxygenase SsuD/methylene tetrahydromethanopterin reductase-like flavin-dependent oxidoreductase (Luciferase family) n=4 Tax=Rhizobium TaxID=379 RepID=A0A6P1CE91_RHITR|nr:MULTISPECIES: LLM class flavin-dependent oxidoreductase [Rhizobium]AGB73410.1 putative monooxygenase protein [Rhizobium tropici CIAT 899]AYG76747.1 LLM class flavin-dependent oxidoreductase [Rhizobium sp. CCGE532]ENN86705.1 putative monooxygenase protein [Rhizobium freirei PRF 81]MBB4245550.1 alkanesulfonate monooxygenase SsuD/methylene tetrahydromethanopterin reductase-like flavin-dependent oxidoreductase (luciferase family) [Rhizobium tropici]MBB5596838.1 alkanesulfonate monooxygenase Ssu